MGKQVVIIASGETERRSLPHLVAHLESEGVVVLDVRIPPRNRALNVEMAEKLLKAAWYGSKGQDHQPDKFVILVDTDAHDPAEILLPYQENLPPRVAEIPAMLQFAVAQRHLEAWYFADIMRLKAYLGRAPGVDTSKPDEIQNPKLQLKQLLGDRMYTAVISEEIATKLEAQVIAQRSPSFQKFLEAVRNGNASSSSEQS